MRSCCLPVPDIPAALSLQTQLRELLGVTPSLPFLPSLVIFHVNHFRSLADLLVPPAVGRNNAFV